MSFNNRFQNATVLMFAGWLVLVAGCGGGVDSGPTGTVAGTVTFKGKAVSEARIQYQSTVNGKAGVATMGSDGSYQVETPLPVGKCLVTINPITNVPLPGAAEDPDAKPEIRKDIPLKYQIPGKNGLSFEIEEGDNTFDIELKN